MKNKFKWLSTASLVGLLAAVTGCGIFDTKNKGRKIQENDNQLSGKWENSCSKLDWLGFAYHRISLNFSALGDFDKTTQLFGDANCSEETAKLTEHGTYASLGDSPAGDGAQTINFTISEAAVTAGTDNAVSLFNTVSYCGISDWQKGKVTDILDKPCAGVQHPKGSVIFDIYKVDTKEKILTMGKGSFFLDKSDAKSRPTNFDGGSVFKKK